jgi:hypothetical protein
MTKVEDFRALSLYKRSLELTLAVYQFVEKHQDCLSKHEALELRKTAVSITLKIAFANGQVNMNILFKLLNEVKDDLLPSIDRMIHELIGNYKLEVWEKEGINSYSIQVLKLIKAYLAKVSKEKNDK